ncbi:MAG: FAD-dependent oxidoreductase [Rhizobiaceae bacterium]|nr:FAD-dependent oxidoreductase [Rhizobiaceae bacterium]
MAEPAISSFDVLVIGGGAAGVAAAAELASAGLSVALAEQRPTLGGAYHRQPVGGSARQLRGQRQWLRLLRGLAGAGVEQRLGHVFIGLESDGIAMLDDRAARRIRSIKARALVIAVGAIERVLPRPGWQLDGVMTSGGLQMLLKETGGVPPGDLLIAGSGPLNVAVAADLIRLGRPPVAVIENGNPFARPGAALRLAAHPGLVAEAARHLARLASARVPWLRGSALAAIERRDGRLRATVRMPGGGSRMFAADIVALHDGIRPNAFGLPAETQAQPIVVRAGDCREALGIRAAVADGRHAARQVAAMLAGTVRDGSADRKIGRQRRAQAILHELFRPVDGYGLAALPDDTILCRCEGRTVGDLRLMLAETDAPGLREIKLNGRFGMGLCQGRFCADAVRDMVAAARPAVDGGASGPLSRDRWPLRPASIAALAADDELQEGK